MCFVDDDDDDSALTEQRNCLRGAAPGGERKSKPRQSLSFREWISLDFFLMFLNFLTVEKCPGTNNLLGEGVRNYHYHDECSGAIFSVRKWTFK